MYKLKRLKHNSGESPMELNMISLKGNQIDVGNTTRIITEFGQLGITILLK